MSYDEQRISNQIDGSIYERDQFVKQLHKSYLSGQTIINYIIDKLKKQGIPPEDTCILTELRLLTSYELKQIL
ncbi:MAG: hypothetical protein JXB49_05295 [Bacteroidales bacterium]|nr:hypothetical protein [Bacteroidales bacterium]